MVFPILLKPFLPRPFNNSYIDYFGVAGIDYFGVAGLFSRQHLPSLSPCTTITVI